MPAVTRVRPVAEGHGATAFLLAIAGGENCSWVTYDLPADSIAQVWLDANDPNVSRLLNEKTATSERWAWPSRLTRSLLESSGAVPTRQRVKP